jgi:hypothetical protein
MDAHIDVLAVEPQVRTSRQVPTYWAAFAVSLALFASLAFWWIYAPEQDHIASIPLDGDGTWYHNYEIAAEIQDQEILYHGIGHSIDNARQADIIFLGWSRLIFGMDWRVFEEFERKHHLKMFNMGLAGVFSGEFSRRIIDKWGLHPKLWIINTDRDLKDHRFGFFYMSLQSAANFRTGGSERVVTYSRMQALKHVIGRNLRWRVKMAVGGLKIDPYRSAKTGNWHLDNWPHYASGKNPPIKPLELSFVDGAPHTSERVDWSCPVLPEEVDSAKEFVKAIGGAVALIQMPSSFACAQRVQELASGIAAPSFTVDATQFTSIDGGGHLDRISARKYSTMLFEWLEQLPEFQRLFPNEGRSPERASAD